MATQRVEFPAASEDAPLLEGELWLPDGAEQVPGVVVAHPHPQRGGAMDSNVVMALCLGLREAGIAHLRFNFRGVGHSQGKSTGGDAEAADVLGALSFLAEHPRILADVIGLAGYSFGARMCLAALPGADGVRAVLCVAPPLRAPLPWDEQPSGPFLVLVGDQDGLVAEGVEQYASYLPDPEVLQVVPGTDHFWRGFEAILVDAAHKFFSAALIPA